MKKLLLIILFALCIPVFGQYHPLKMFGQQLNLGHWSTDGLVFLWRGIEAGNVVDESFYRNHGTITGATWAGDGLVFNGTNQKVSGGPVTNNGELTVIVKFKVGADAAWPDALFSIDSANLAAATLDCNIHYNGGDYRAYFSDGSVLQYVDIGSTEIVASVVNTMAATIDSSRIDVYLNGVWKKGDAKTIGAVNSGHNLNICATTSSYYWPGTVYDVKIYNRALSASEIQQLYLNPDLPMQQDPIWLMYSPAPAVSGQVIFITKAEKDYGFMSPMWWLMPEWYN